MAKNGLRREGIDRFEKIQAQLDGFYGEITTLSKKSPGDALNPFKLKFINQILGEANGLLSDPYRPFVDFDQFDEDEAPLWDFATATPLQISTADLSVLEAQDEV